MSNQITLTKENLNETTLVPAKATPSLWNNRSVLVITNAASVLLTAGTLAAVILGGPITLIVALASAALVALTAALKSVVARLQATRITLESQISETEKLITTEETPSQKTETLEIQTEKQTELSTTNEETGSEISETETEETTLLQKTESENETPVNSVTKETLVEIPKETTPNTRQKAKSVFATVVNFAKQHPYLVTAGALATAGLAGYAAYGAYAAAPALLSDATSQSLQLLNNNQTPAAFGHYLTNSQTPAVLGQYFNATSADQTPIYGAFLNTEMGVPHVPNSHFMIQANEWVANNVVPQVHSVVNATGTLLGQTVENIRERAATITEQVAPHLQTAMDKTRNLLGSYNITHMKGTINNVALTGLNAVQKTASENSATLATGAAVSLALAGALAVKRNSAKAKRAALVQRIKNEQAKYKTE